MEQPDHPLWQLASVTLTTIIKPILLSAALTAFLYVTAKDFDETEGQTIASFFMAAIGVEGVGRLFGGKR